MNRSVTGGGPGFPSSCCLAALLLVPACAIAQAPVLVKDINAVADTTQFMGVGSLTDVNGTLFFGADATGFNGLLWKSDGTAGGTTMVRDTPSNPSLLTNVNGTVFFTASDPTHGTELWKSNGTAAGTVLVKDIAPGTNPSDLDRLVNVSGTLFFVATDGVHGHELWKSDGTAAGTVMVKDINPGSADSYPGYLTIISGTLFFEAWDGANGFELWKSDGTAAGTVMVRDIYPGSVGSNPLDLVNVNGTVFFVADSPGTGRELWKSDGTANGTVMVSDIYPGSTGSGAFNLTNVNGTLFFAANDGVHGAELWKSDGTAAGTVMVKDTSPGFFGGIQQYTDFRNVNGTLFFVATDFGPNGEELWKSDGTAAGTVMVKDINPGSGDSAPATFTNENGTLYFIATDGVNGRALWKSDGTAAGTLMVRAFIPAADSPISLTWVNGALYFVTSYGPTREVLWKSDGTTAGTSMVQVGTAGSVPANLANVNGTLFFAATDGISGDELWKSDGTAVGTVMVKDINPGALDSGPFDFANANGTLFFVADDVVHGRELWKSDGTAGGTSLVKDILPDSSGASYGSLVPLDGAVFFVTGDGVNGYQLWKSDGTTAGTVKLKDYSPHSIPSYLTNLNGTLFFAADDGTLGSELWKSDGTPAGTVMVKDIYSGPANSLPSNLVNVNGTLFFNASDGAPGLELWKSDGTAAGTVIVKTLPSGPQYSGAGAFANMNGTLFFEADDGVNGVELWKSDGTAAGTVMVKDINAGSASSYPNSFTYVNGTVFFEAYDGVDGTELWKSDGTTAGTVMVKDIAPGSVNSSPLDLTSANGTLFFVASDGLGGHGLWKSDGTSAGTVSMASNALYSPNVIALACPNVCFVASNPATGWELWALGTGPGGTAYRDQDGDGYGSGISYEFCAGTPGFAGNNGDCDDTDPNVHPGAPDATCNGIDNNCSGAVDEGVAGCVCIENAPGLAGWWRGNASALDEVGGNNGALTGGAGYAAGRVGYAFSFDGATGYVAHVGDTQSFSFIENTGVFTIDAWIQLNDVNETTEQAITASTATTSEKGHYFTWENSTGLQRLTLALTQQASGTPVILSTSPSHVITTNGWHHVAAVGNGTTVKFYVDGVGYPGTGTMTNRLIAASTRPVDIGHCPASSPACMFHGLIDELQIYDRALSMSEIRAIFNTGANGMCGTGCLQNLTGLVGWWPGNGDANDRSLSNNNGSLGAGAAFSAGKVGQAFDFHDGGYAFVADKPSLEVTSQLTLAAWIRPSGAVTNNSARIMSKWTVGSSAYELLFDSNDSRLIRSDISNDGTNYDALAATTSLPTDVWTHVATTFDAGVWKLYVNGAEAASKVSSITSIYSAGTSPLYLGAYSFNSSKFTGGVDEPMVFNRALSAAEIKAIYDAGSSGMCGLGLVVSVDDPVAPPTSFGLAPPWPNPSTRTTYLRFQLPTAAVVRAEVFDVAGRRVATLIDGRRMTAGEQRVVWDGRDQSGKWVARGVFQIRVAAGGSVAVRKVVMIR